MPKELRNDGLASSTEAQRAYIDPRREHPLNGVYVDVYADDNPSPEEYQRRVDAAMNSSFDALGTDFGLRRWPSREERQAAINCTPHPRSDVLIRMAQAMCGQERWADLPDDEKQIWRGYASEALKVIEPAVDWSRFIHHVDDPDIIY